jgi:anti-sigma factor RsiW
VDPRPQLEKVIKEGVGLVLRHPPYREWAAALDIVLHTCLPALYGHTATPPLKGLIALNTRLPEALNARGLVGRRGVGERGLPILLAHAAAALAKGGFAEVWSGLEFYSGPPGALGEGLKAHLAAVEAFRDVWRSAKGMVVSGISPPIEGPSLDRETLLEEYRRGFLEFEAFYAEVFPPRLLRSLRGRALRGEAPTPRDLARATYSLMAAYRVAGEERSLVAEAYIKLLAGWLARLGDDPDRAVAAASEAFTREKGYLRYIYP